MDAKSQNDELLARAGWHRVDGTGAVTDIPHYGLQVREDTVISVWKVYGSDDTEYDLVSRFGLSGKTITTDDPALIVPLECRGSNKHTLTLTSGSVNLLKKY